MSTMLKLYSWNVNGLRAVIKKGAFPAFIEQCQPDILCLQETKAKQGQAQIDLPIYREHWNSAVKPGYSGTAIFSKIEPIQVINGLPQDIIDSYDWTLDAYGDPNDEGRVVAAEFDDFWLATVYTPNAKDDLTRIPLRQLWDHAYRTYMERLAQHKPVIFCGDLNVAHNEIDLARPKPNIGKKGFTAEERGGFQAYIDAGLIDTFRTLHPERTGAYTWWSLMANARARNIGWRIDYFLTSAALQPAIVSADVHMDIMGSDHCPVSLEIDL
jgi:exodeoxyribonuclease-3